MDEELKGIIYILDYFSIPYKFDSVLVGIYCNYGRKVREFIYWPKWYGGQPATVSMLGSLTALFTT